MKDYYKILGLTRDASPESIKQRFRELAFENHPDVSEKNNACEVFVEIYEAYHILSQPDKKSRYDSLYDKYTDNARMNISNEDRLITDIEKDASLAREKAQQKTRVKYRDFIKDLDCFFSDGLKADGIPFTCSLHKTTGISGGPGPMGSIKSMTVNIPIPRSKKAHLSHRIGFLIKALFLVIAVFEFKLDILTKESWIIQAMVSSSVLLIGGFTTMITYHLLKVRSKFFFVWKYPLVKKYRGKGYKRGFHPMMSTTPIGLIGYILRLVF